MTDVEKCDINVMVGNCQKMECELKVSVNMKLQDGKKVKITEFLYIPQAVNTLLSLSRLVSEVATMGETQEKMIIEKNGVSMNLDASKGQNTIMIFYLKEMRYAPEGQEALTNMPENKIETSNEK